MADDQDLDALKRQVAFEHLGNASLGTRLRGGNRRQLAEDAEALRVEAGLRDTGERYSRHGCRASGSTAAYA